MRNLRNIKDVAVEFDVEQAPITASAWDGDDLICAFGPSERSDTISLKRLGPLARAPDQADLIASWDAPSPTPDLSFDRILSLHCFADTGLKCIVFEGGDIVVVREAAQPGEDTISIVGSVDAGIIAATWSPDQELLIIATKADTLLFMTPDFEGVASATLSAEDLTISNHVSVGWGKSETQFKGRGAKALHDPTLPERIDAGVLGELDDGRATISWRGDSLFVAVNSILRGATDRRVIRVYTREGVLDSVSEAVDGLESALSWKPSGQILAGCQRVKGGAINVVFFERNGLRHGEFGLRLSQEECATVGSHVQLYWSSDSFVLAVALKDRIQLWTVDNYHYYLKQEILSHASPDHAIGMTWSPEHALRLSCFQGPSLRLLDHALVMSRGAVEIPHDIGLTLVMDGKNLKITPLRLANIPPPFALEEIELPFIGLDAAVDPCGTLLAVLHFDSVSIWNMDFNVQSRKPPTLKDVVRFDAPTRDKGLYVHRLISIGTDNCINVLSATPNSATSTIFQISHTGDIREAKVEDFSAFAESPQARETPGLFCQDHLGIVYEMENDGACITIGKLAQHAIDVQVWQTEIGKTLFGLTANGVLHIESKEQVLKIPGCTSFIITATHLIFTTAQHLLKFVHLQAGAELNVPSDEPEKDERCRSIERGAKLVTAMPSNFSLVLQMPRGNLETVYPRALVLAGIRLALDGQDYKKAFSICRTHRVDMNILHDYAPAQFLKDVKLFIAQVKKVDHVDLFLSSLSEEDVSVTIYKDTLMSKSNSDPSAQQTNQHERSRKDESKVNRVCTAFLSAFKEQTAARTQNIITAHVCKAPPDLEAGLEVIALLRKQQDPEQLERAVGHICFLADVNQLYDAALGLYELEVALLVAQQSQKDPREYLPYLQKLQDLSALRRQFAIDNDLKRYVKALRHLHVLGDFDEFKKFMSSHELHNEAIDLYRYDASRLKDLMRIYAEFLSSRNRYKESGIAFEYVGEHAAACEAYCAGGMWRECLSSATLSGMSMENVQELAHDLVTSLEESKNFVAAATLSLDYLADLKSSVRFLCQGFEFSEAIRQISLRQQNELLTELVDPGMIDASAMMTEMLAEMKGQLNAQVPRLRELRQKKFEDPMSFLDGEGDRNPHGDVPDNISLAPTDASTSGGTFMTRYTNHSTGTLGTTATRKTSKNRRREERKRAKGKKGTVYEEEYLVNSIARLIDRLNSMEQDVSKLIEGLLRRTMRERAVAIDNVLRDVIETCDSHLVEVFGGPTAAQSSAEMDVNLAARPLGGQGVLWDALNASQENREAPVLKSFARLGLLG